ncbi:Uncharacterised protein [Mycobacteroides abscessus subsp. abscessus]|nr:Uncharacterised protein [Mycobacteroides abscessus subsp. abscessus]
MTPRKPLLASSGRAASVTVAVCSASSRRNTTVSGVPGGCEETAFTTSCGEVTGAPLMLTNSSPGRSTSLAGPSSPTWRTSTTVGSRR